MNDVLKAYDERFSWITTASNKKEVSNSNMFRKLEKLVQDKDQSLQKKIEIMHKALSEKVM